MKEPSPPVAQSALTSDHIHTEACDRAHENVTSLGRPVPESLVSCVGSSCLVGVSDGAPGKAEEGGTLDARQPTTTQPAAHQEPHTARHFPYGTLDLSDHTTFHTGGAANTIVVARSEGEMIGAVREADESGTPVLVLSGGSNVLISDEGFPGVVVLVASSGISADVSACSGAYLTVAAGETWDHVVAQCVDHGWMGLEALSGIPGLAGAAPVQNIGAYGAQVADSIARVRTWDREKGEVRTFAASDCGFGYRTSIFKATPGRYVILSLDLQLKIADLAWGVKYAELARYLGVEVGTRVPTRDVRQAVLSLRSSKGMVLDESDHDTWSAGSFFTNPVVPSEVAAALPEDAPRFADNQGVKLSAAWLIEHAGFPKGYAKGAAGLSTKHVLAITNRGGASTQEILSLARDIRDGVRTMYGVTLVPEPVLVGVDW